MCDLQPCSNQPDCYIVSLDQLCVCVCVCGGGGGGGWGGACAQKDGGDQRRGGGKGCVANLSDCID